MNGAIKLTFKVFCEMVEWFGNNPSEPEVRFINEFFTDGSEKEKFYRDEWVDGDRLLGESFEDSWRCHLYSKCMEPGDYDTLKEFFQTAMLNTISYKHFLMLFDSFNYKYASNPFKFDENNSVTCIEPAVREMYIACLVQKGWKRAGKRKTKKVNFNIPRYWNFKAKEYWFKGNEYIAVDNKGWTQYAKA